MALDGGDVERGFGGPERIGGQPRRQPVDGDRRQRVQPQRAVQPFVPQRLNRGGDVGEARIQRRGQAAAGVGQLHGATDTAQQLDAQQVFQRAQLVADRRGRDRQFQGRVLIERWRAAASKARKAFNGTGMRMGIHPPGSHWSFMDSLNRKSSSPRSPTRGPKLSIV